MQNNYINMYKGVTFILQPPEKVGQFSELSVTKIALREIKQNGRFEMFFISLH